MKSLHFIVAFTVLISQIIIPVLAGDDSGNDETNAGCDTAALPGFNSSSLPDNETLQSRECSSPALEMTRSAAFASSSRSCVGDGRALMEIHAPPGSMYAARSPWGWFDGGNPNWVPTGPNGITCRIANTCGYPGGQWEIRVKLPDGTIKSSGIFYFSQYPAPSGSNARCYYLFDVTSVTPTPSPLPVAKFTADPTTGYKPLIVKFTDTSTGLPASWSWNFGDGSTSTEHNPQHTYTTAGTYTVRLTATNSAGSNTVEKAGMITVEAPAYSMTNTFSVYAGKDNCDNMVTILNGNGWGDPVLYKTMESVTKADFGFNPSPYQKTLNDATLHYHVGHGLVPYFKDGDPKIHSGLGLLDQPNNFLSPSDVENKWGNKNKWVILHSCYALQDERWGKALSTSHGILGFKTMVNIKPEFTQRFFHYAIDEERTVYSAYRLTTYDLYQNDPVPSKVIPGTGDPDYSSEPEIPVAAVVFKTQTQADRDYLPGIMTGIAPDAIPGERPSLDEWRCNEGLR